MIGIPEERAIKVARYIIDNKATVRDAGKVFSISKSTAHKDITTRLQKLNPELYLEVREILDTNKLERHIRGGVATREKYKKMHT
ncbi:MAG: sporulation transcriptional regulator SpoIIID [Clostridia bacterium]